MPGLRRTERAVLKRKTEFLIKNDEFNVFDRLQGLEMRKNAFFAAKNILVITPKLRLVNYTKCTNGVFDYKAGSFFETVFFMGFLGFSSDFERNVRNNDVGGAFRLAGKSPIYIDKSRIISEYP